jgi:hypothetical protein
MIILAGPSVLSAVGACPPHDGARRRWRINVASAVALSDARKKSDDLTTATVPAGTTCRGNPVISLRVLRGRLLHRPVELGSVDPHAVQNDRELPRDSDLGLAEAVSLGELGSPSPSAPTISARGSAARRLPRTDTCAAWHHRTSRFGRTNRSPRRHGDGSSIRYRLQHFSIA